jgi:diguanylate cyclase (GGDEF)-like protein
VSIGVASYPLHGETYKTLVESSDKALYRAKQEGRDRVCTASEPEPPLKLAT